MKLLKICMIYTHTKEITSIIYFVVYLYGDASQQSYRKSLPQIRAGEYEALPEKVRSFYAKLRI